MLRRSYLSLLSAFRLHHLNSIELSLHMYHPTQPNDIPRKVHISPYVPLVRGREEVIEDPAPSGAASHLVSSCRRHELDRGSIPQAL